MLRAEKFHEIVQLQLGHDAGRGVPDVLLIIVRHFLLKAGCFLIQHVVHPFQEGGDVLAPVAGDELEVREFVENSAQHHPGHVDTHIDVPAEARTAEFRPHDGAVAVGHIIVVDDVAVHELRMPIHRDVQLSGLLEDGEELRLIIEAAVVLPRQ